MKKFIAAFCLLICAVVVLLASIDLGPYLAPDKAATKVTENLTGQERAAATKDIKNTEQAPQLQQIQPEESMQMHPPAPPVDEIFPEQEQVVMAPPKKTTAVAEEKIPEILPSPIELEVTVLPVGDYPFSILLATFQEKDTAERGLSLYRKQGISAYWVKVNLGEMGIRYRLFTGTFSTMPEAQQYLKQSALVDKLIKPTYYAARVGVYTDKTELARAYRKTRQADVIPYILGTTKGDYYLYVGAFYTYVGAIDQCRELAAAGLTCEPVKRSTVPPY